MSALLVSAAPPLGADAYATLRRRAIFDCCKWDPQVGDRSALAPFPLLLDRPTWREISGQAEALARETLEAEAELLARPELHGVLGLPRGVRRRLAEVSRHGPSRGAARVLRFDFHPTPEGWRITEVNSDVPGGFVEASGVTDLVAAHYPGWTSSGDPRAALARAVRAQVPAHGTVALVHATSYTDDHQVMAYLARALSERGLCAALVAPTQLRWEEGRARLDGPEPRAAVDLVLRFFPAEWLPEASLSCGWPWFFRGARTPLANPAHALLTQTKRFPLVFDRLETPLAAWRALLPETRDPRDVPWRDDGRWVLKPALGRVGDSIGMKGVTDPRTWKAIERGVRWFPGGWVAQRRFDSVPVETPAGAFHACVGVFTVDGRTSGAYGRVAQRPLVDGDAQDAAVLVGSDGGNG